MKTKNLLSGELPKPVTINKFLVLLAMALFALVIGLAVVSAFAEPADTASQNAVTSGVQDLTTTESPILSDLPKGYQETDKINAYSHHDDDKVSLAVQKELSLLKQQQHTLETRLASLSNQPASRIPTRDMMQAEQARSSGLFFPGSAPPSQTQMNVGERQGDASANNSSPADAHQASARYFTSSYNRQNMQDQKMEFLQSDNGDPLKDNKAIYNPHSLVTAASPYEVQAGTLLPAVLITGIMTSLPGQVVAQVREDIYDSVTGRYLLIPKGSKLLGQYDSQVSYGQSRVLIAFTRIIRPDGSSILLDKLTGADMDGQSGMQGDVDNHWGRVLGAATLSTLLSMGAGAASDTVGDNNTYYRSSAQNAILGGANNISQVGQQLTSRAIDIQPTLTINPGYEFNVIVNKDMVLSPYQGIVT